MAGSRHHQVPQFLMKGFASRIIPKKKEDTIFVWTYRKNTAPFECNTVNVGIERKFYSDKDVSVDPQITELEGPLANCLNDLRRSPDGARVTDSRFLEFVVHLTSRTKHLRDSIVNTGGFLADSLLSYLSNNWREYFGTYFAKNRGEITSRLEKSLQDANASPFQKAKARQLVNSLTKKDIIRLMEHSQNYDAIFPSVREYLGAQVNDIVKQAHIESLVKNLISDPRVEHFQRFHWFARRPTETLILGDVCCLFQIDSKFKSLGGVEDNIQRIYVPISSDCAVVGNVADELPNLNPAELNEASAKVSRDYFVTKECSAEMSRLQNLLGSDSELLTRAELEQIVTEVIETNIGKN